MTSRPTGANVRRLAKLIETGERGVFAIDSRRRLVYINGPLAELLEVEPSEVVGAVIQFGVINDADPQVEKLSRLAPPPVPLSGDQRPRHWSISLPADGIDEKTKQFPALFVPMSDLAEPSQYATSPLVEPSPTWLGIVWLPVRDARAVRFSTDGTAGWDPQISERGPADLLMPNRSPDASQISEPREVAGAISSKADVATQFNPGDPAWVNELELAELLTTFRTKYKTLDELWPLLGNSPAIFAAMQQTQLAVHCNANVLLIGPDGTGKQELAKAIFSLRLRELGMPASSGNLVVIDCSLMDNDLLAGMLELVEHHRSTRWTAENQMVLFHQLDRLSPTCMQPLSKWLAQASTVRIAATLSSVSPQFGSEQEIAGEECSAPLPCPEWEAVIRRIGILRIELPSLADRPTDITPLATYFLAEAARSGTRRHLSFTTAAIERLVTFPWHGNTRQLRELVRQSIPDRGTVVDVDDLPIAIRSYRESADTAAGGLRPIELDTVLATVEKELIRRALKESGGNRAQAARLLGISRPRLLRSIQQFELGEPRSDANDDE